MKTFSNMSSQLYDLVLVARIIEQGLRNLSRILGAETCKKSENMDNFISINIRDLLKIKAGKVF